MADITMCKQSRCPLATSCYRYLATPSEYQAYFIMDEVPEKCDEYWECKTQLDLDWNNKYWRD